MSKDRRSPLNNVIMAGERFRRKSGLWKKDESRDRRLELRTQIADGESTKEILKNAIVAIVSTGARALGRKKS